MRQEVLAAQTEALGACHPDTLRTQGNLAVTLNNLGRFEESLQMQQEVLAALTEVLGASHPDTLRTQGNLAVTLKDLGKFEEALRTEAAVLAARTEALGASHPDTLTHASKHGSDSHRTGQGPRKLYESASRPWMPK